MSKDFELLAFEDVPVVTPTAVKLSQEETLYRIAMPVQAGRITKVRITTPLKFPAPFLQLVTPEMGITAGIADITSNSVFLWAKSEPTVKANTVLVFLKVFDGAEAARRPI